MESSATTGRTIPQTSKKRVFPGSSTFMESEIQVSSPPVDRTLKRKKKLLKKNEDAVVMISSGANHTEDHHMMDVVSSSKEDKSRKKGKGVLISSARDDVIQLDSMDRVSDSRYGKDYMDIYADDYVSDDEYAVLQSHFDNIDLPTGVEASVPQFLDSIKMKNNMTSASLSLMGISEGRPLRSSAEPAKGTHTSSSACPSLQLERDTMKVQSVKKPHKARRHKMFSGSGGGSSRDGNGPAIEGVPKDACLGIVGAPDNAQKIPMEDVKLDQDSGKCQKSINAVGSSSSMGQVNGDDDVVRKYRNFKKFDILEDHSDHHYAARNSAITKPLKNWVKRIEEEWRILKNNLPDTIFVRVYESRIDLLRAAIIGAEGTPYHDGLFFFDVRFPSNYPSSPPQVYYRSGGLHINPNLYDDGKVCLSLLNTWVGGKNEKWVPNGSTMLQVLVSIQGLILNAKPYFNEPAYADLRGSTNGEKQSLIYNEQTLILSLKTMVYTMKNAPKHFEDLVIGHFRNNGHDILKACKAHTKGVEGEWHSGRFKSDVEKCMKTLTGAFKQIGLKDLEEYVEQKKSLTQKIKAFFGF